MSATEVFRALADPTRRAVYERLAAAEMNVSQLKAGFAISQPAVSQHLSALRGAGLVSERREGRFVYYRANPQALAPVADWIERYRSFWPERAESLRQLLKEIEP